MNTKLLLVSASLLAIASVSAQESHCTSTVSGFYGAIGVGYGVTTVKDTVTVKAAELKGVKNFSTISPVVQDLTSYTKYINAIAANNTILSDYSVRAEATAASADWNIGVAVTTAAANRAAMDTDVKGKLVLQAIDKEMVKFSEQLEKAGGKLSTKPTEIDYATTNAGVFTNITAIKAILPGETTETEIIASGTTVATGNGIDDAGKLTRMKSTLEALQTAWSKVAAKIQGMAVVTLPAVTGGKLVANTPGAAEKIQDIKELEQTPITGHKNQFIINAKAGYQHAFGSFYTGLELGAEFTPGKVLVQDFSAATETHTVGTAVATYATAVKGAQPKVEMKTKYSFGITPMVGVTAGNWMFYIPVTLKMTKYEAKVTSASFGNVPTPTKVTYVDSDTAHINPTLTDPKLTGAGTAGNNEVFTKSKTKFGFEFGLGAKVMLTQNFFVGVRYMYSPKTTFTFDTPAYAGMVHDVYAAGATHKTKIESHKGTLELGYKF